MNVGDIVWIDGTTPAIVVGQGHDAANVADGRVFVARLGDAELIEPDDDGGYPFGNSPYDTNAGSGDAREPVNPGGFGPNTPAIVDQEQRAGMALPGNTPQPTGGFDPHGTDTANDLFVDRTPSGDADYVDNGDGTYTRSSDGVRGTFGPNGFAPTTDAASWGTGRHGPASAPTSVDGPVAPPASANTAPANTAPATDTSTTSPGS